MVSIEYVIDYIYNMNMCVYIYIYIYWKRLMLGKIEGKRRRGQQRMRQLYSITSSMDRNLSKL